MISPWVFDDVFVRIAQHDTREIDLVALFPRNVHCLFQTVVIVLEPGSTVVCHDMQQKLWACSTLRSLIIHVKQGAQFFYIGRLQGQADQMNAMTVFVESDGYFLGELLCTGSSNMFLTMNCELFGEAAHAQMRIGAVLTGTAVWRIISRQHHRASRTVSIVLITCAVYDTAWAFYEGTIVVDAHARNSQACQKHKSLLLGDGASAYARPSFEVDTNEVRCTHASAIGRLDELQLLYLQNRGMSAEKAQQHLVGAFFNELYANDSLKSEMRCALQS